jgi:sugar lactone lactonase YvrE
MNQAKRFLQGVAALFVLLASHAASAQLVTGLEGASGSTVGPDKALYVTEGAAGRISRVDPVTGEVTTFASGLPASIIGVGGAVDVAFIGNTAYALVTLVGPDVAILGPFVGTDIVGIYRVDGPNQFTVIANIGAFTMANPTSTPYFVPSGVQYALEPFRGGFLVTDGHHNRVLQVSLDGHISIFREFDNIVPTGLAVHGNTVYMAEAGPVPHLPETGKVVAINAKTRAVAEVAAGARLLVDVEFGRGQALYALSQGFWDGPFDGTPADPYTGSLVKVRGDGGFDVLATGLNIPTSFQFIGNTAYVVTLTGEIWAIPDVSRPPFGRSH